MRLSALSLKLIAIAAMVVDHVAFTFVPYGTPLWTVMDAVGKLTGPIMFYMAVEGFHHTRSIRRYLARLASVPSPSSISAPWVSRSRWPPCG